MVSEKIIQIALVNTGHFFSGLLAGLFISAITAVIFVPPARGAVMRIVGVFGSVMLLLFTGISWAAATGVVHEDFPAATKYGVAVSFSLTTHSVIKGLLDGSWREESGEPRSGNRPARRVVRVLDYALGTFLCYYFLTLGVTFKSHQLHVYFLHWLEGFFNARMAEVATQVMVTVAGLLYAQLISGAAIRAMNTALRHDWQVSRAWNYLLLTPPFLLFMPKASAAPGLLAGVVTHLAILFLGWRYTRERPQTTLKTLRLVRQQSASVRKARNQTGHGA
ncbi:MAG: hypothetical protein ACRDOA_18125 [Streptosporangiaceae bacterium]